MDRDIQALIARLLAHRALPREDALARRALTDEAFRQELDLRLSNCGLELLDNPYASHVAAGIKRELEEAVFGAGEQWLNNNMGLQKDGVALLIILWALMILPKRERQIARRERGDTGQGDMFAEAKPMPRGEEVSGAIAEATLLADFGDKLGGKMRLNVNLGVLSRLGFIARRNKIIHEGPLLDLLLDYPLLERRIIDGALADLLARRSELARELEPVVSDPDEDI
ncbi:MAG: hypothetical protein ACREVJ_08330 [Gammaproteobacteria bacterium]